MSTSTKPASRVAPRKPRLKPPPRDPSPRDVVVAQRLGPGNYREIARRTGYQHQHISRVLRGIGGVSLECARKIAEATDVTIDEVERYRQSARARTAAI